MVRDSIISSSSDSKSEPQTPARRESNTLLNDENPSASTRSSFEASEKDIIISGDSLNDSSVASPSSSHARRSLASARHIRSTSSPFLLPKARYVLTFASASIAREWWTLIQIEYPETVRESPQLFAFQSEGIPVRASESGKFAHLRNKWTFRQLDDWDKENHVGVGRSIGKRGGAGAGGASLSMSAARSPLMPIVRHSSPSPELVRDAEGGLEDPFTPRGGRAGQEAGLAQLGITSERIHKTVSKTCSSMSLLLDGQQASAKGMQKMQAAMERVTLQMDGLALRQQEQDEVMSRMQSAIGQSASEIYALCKTSHEDTPRTRDLRTLQRQMSHNSTQLDTLLENQKTEKKSLQKMQAALDHQEGCQRLLAEGLQAIQTANIQNQLLFTSMIDGQNVRLEKPLTAFEKHTAETRRAMIAQRKDFDLTKKDIIAAVRDTIPSCEHEVIPPPRKVNRRLVGYVYSRNGS